MKLDELLKQITPLPWQTDGRFLSGSEFRSGTPFIADIAISSSHWKPGQPKAHAAYLAHSANMLPKLANLAERSLLALHEDDFPSLRQELRDALAEAQEVKV